MSCEHGLTTNECYVCMSPKYPEKTKEQGTLDFSRGWDAGYNYASMRFKNNFEQYLRLAITAAVEKAGAETFRHFVNHYKNETCKEKTHD